MAGETYNFAITKTISGKTGYLIQSFGKTSAGDIAEARGNDGYVKEVTCYNKNEEITFEAIIPASDTPPAFGDTVTVDSNTYTVTSATRTENNTDYEKYSCTAKRYIAASSSASV